MRLKLIITLGVVLLMGFSSIAAVSSHAITTSGQPAALQAQTCDQQDNDSSEPANTPDTDSVDQQCGEQVEDGLPDGEENSSNESDSAVQDPAYTGSIAIAQNQDDSLSESQESAALQAQATITASEAENAALNANPGTTVVKSELDNENGTLVYSVELSSGMDVKVDAGNGSILFSDSAAGNEG